MVGEGARGLLSRRHMIQGLAAGLSACASPTPKQGRRVRLPQLDSAQVLPRAVDVWLPAGYDAGSVPHAVLYMHDGQHVFDEVVGIANAAWGVHTALQGLLDLQAARPTIVVAVANTRERSREYGPQAPIETLPVADQVLLPRLTDGPEGQPRDERALPLSDRYLRFLVEELKPQVDRSFRTLPDRENTFVMGSSMGGLISLYALCSYPQVFGGAGCLSTHWPMATNPALFTPTLNPLVGRAAAAYRQWLAGHLPAAGSHRVYFDHGTETLDALYAPHQQQVDALMRSKGWREGVDWTSRVFPGTNHSEAAWRARVEQPLKFLLRR